MQKLIIKKYGRFTERTFDLSPVTVFFGGNESGKTTVFDAMFEQLCRIAPKNSALWRRLTARYGDLSMRIADADVSMPYNSGEEYISLFSIRASDLSFDSGKDAWAAAAGRNLFFQGVDTLKISDDLRKTAEPGSRTSDYKNYQLLEAELKSAEADLKAKMDLERLASGQKKNIESIAGELRSLELKAEQLKEAISAQNRKIESLKKERNLVRSLSSRSIVGEFVSKKKFCDSNPFLSVEGLQEYDAMVNNRNAAKAQYDAAMDYISKCEQRLAEIEKALPAQEQKRKDAEMLEGAAEHFKDKIDEIFEFRKKNEQFKETPVIFGLVAPILSILGIAAAIALHTKTMVAWLLLPAGIIAGVMFHKSFIRRRDRAAEKAKEHAMINEIISSWSERFDPAPIQGLSPDQILVKFSEIAKVAEKERNLHKEMVEQKEKAQMSITDSRGKSTGVLISYDTAKASTDSWLEERGFSDRDSYLRAAEQKKMAEQFISEHSGQIEALMASESCMSPEALLALLDSRVKNLGKNGTEGRDLGLIEQEIASEELSVKNSMSQLHGLEEEIRKTAVDKARNDSDFENACSTLPGEIAALRTKILSLKERISAEDTKRKAAGLAANVLSAMNSDASSKFKELARKAMSFLSGILPSSDINIAELSLNGITMKDAVGTYRTPEMLSSGSRDCLMLAIRLCLAQENFGGREKVMLLDDPFINMDNLRMSKALAVLRRFHAMTGCQLIFFTKDLNLLGLLEKDVRVKVHKLP